MDKKYIITDPCYIMDEKQYDAICADDCDFEGQGYPLMTCRRKDGVPIKIHKLSGTPNGDGSYEYHGQQIGVDAGMLCIAEIIHGNGKPAKWERESFGATFNTLEEAKSAFPRILKHF